MTGSLFVSPRFVPVGVTGAPIVGAKLYVYREGTLILANSYTTAALDVAHENPVEADSVGAFPAIYLDPDAGYDYKFVLTNSDDVQVWSEDNYPRTGTTATATGDTGPQGNPGDPGLSVAELVIYLRADAAPSTPTGGEYDFTTRTLTPPTDWTSEIPAGTAPVYASRAVAAVEGTTGTDSLLTWSSPAKVLQDGSSVDIIFRRASAQPSIPAPSSDIPLDWYTDVDSVPASSDKLWSSVGTRAHAGAVWVWQLPIQVEGDTGPQGPAGNDGATGPAGADGASATLWYIKPTNGTAIKNGSGSLTVEARQVANGVDSLLSTGDVQLYVGSTLVTVANGYATGSDGYTGVFDSGDIAGSVVVQLKSGPSGTVRDTITLVDVADGTADTGKDAVYGYVEADGPLAWVRGVDQTTWTPSGTTRQLNCTFVSGGADVARVAWVITRDSSGTLTGASGTHSGGDLNSGRVTVTEFGDPSQVMTVRFNYSNAGDVSAVSETVLTSLAGANGSTGSTGTPGTSAITLQLTKRAIPLIAYSNGTVVSFSGADGYATVFNGTTDVTASTTFSVSATGCTGTINTATDTPVLSYARGYYRVTAASADTATLTISATYSGQTVTEVVTVSKSYVGYEIVSALPTTNLFAGRVVYLTTLDGVNQPNKLYRYTGSAWTASVPTVDLTGLVAGSQIAAATITGANIAAGTLTANNILAGTITGDKIAAGTITAAKMLVTDLSSLTANVGTLTAGVLQSSSGSSRFDLTNARVIYNSAPGITGGYVRVQGGGFGPSSVYLDWYGPKPSGQSTDAGIIANLTDAAALYFLKTDGTQFTRRARGEFEPKAWLKFDGTVGTTSGSASVAQTILDCFNVSGVVRTNANNAGRYTVTFNTPVANANYAVVVSASVDDTASNPLIASAHTHTVNGFQITCKNAGGAWTSGARISAIVFGSNVPTASGGSNVAVPTGGFGGGTYGGGNTP